MLNFKKLCKVKCLNDSTRGFNSIMHYYSLLKDETKTLAEHIAFIDFMMQCIRNEISAEATTEAMYTGTDKKWYCLRDVIPTTTDDNGEKLIVYNEKEMVSVDLSKKCVISSLWKYSSIVPSISSIIKNGFIYYKSNQNGYYYDFLDFGYITNGIHHIMIASVLKTGVTYLTKFDISKLFQHLATNGELWTNIHTNEVVDKVFDFRIAALYELAKIKYNLTTKAAAD